jgi:hypothetical protein
MSSSTTPSTPQTLCIKGKCFGNNVDQNDLTIKNSIINMFQDDTIMNPKPDCINILLCRYYNVFNQDRIKVNGNVNSNGNSNVNGNVNRDYYYDYIMGIYDTASKPNQQNNRQRHTITLKQAYSTNKIANKNFHGDYSGIEPVSPVSNPPNNADILDVTQIDKDYIFVIQISSDDINYDLSSLFKMKPPPPRSPNTTAPEEDSIYFENGQLTIKCPFKFESFKTKPDTLPLQPDTLPLQSILKVVTTINDNGVGDNGVGPYKLVDFNLDTREKKNNQHLELDITGFYKAYIKKTEVNVALTDKLKPLITQLFTTKVIGYFDPDNKCNEVYNNNKILEANYKAIKEALSAIEVKNEQKLNTSANITSLKKMYKVQDQENYKFEDDITIPTADNIGQDVFDFLNLFDKEFKDYGFSNDRIPIGLTNQTLSNTYFSSETGDYVVFLITGQKSVGKSIGKSIGKFSIYGNRVEVKGGSPPNVATRYLKMKDDYVDTDVVNRVNEKIVTFQKNNNNYTNLGKSNLLENIKDAVNTKLRPIKLDALVSYDFHLFTLPRDSTSPVFGATRNSLFDVNGTRPLDGGRITRRKSKSSFKKSQKKRH